MEPVPRTTLSDMVAYYRARAGEYDQWFERRGRYDHGPTSNARWFDEVRQVEDALEGASVQGDILELAAGTGIWTAKLLPRARSLTVVDASPEMIALNRARVGAGVRYIEADLFGWEPDRLYDGVFFGFWLSHVPRERLAAFLDMVAGALRPNGTLFFVDSLRAEDSTAIDHILPATPTQLVSRRLNDGSQFRIVKNFYRPSQLQTAFRDAGLEVRVDVTPTYFIYGTGGSGE